MSFRSILFLSVLLVAGCVADREPIAPASTNPASPAHASAPRSDWADPLLQTTPVTPSTPTPAHQHEHGGVQ
jgi:hypothetical protein